MLVTGPLQIQPQTVSEPMSYAELSQTTCKTVSDYLYTAATDTGWLLSGDGVNHAVSFVI